MKSIKRHIGIGKVYHQRSFCRHFESSRNKTLIEIWLVSAIKMRSPDVSCRMAVLSATSAPKMIAWLKLYILCYTMNPTLPGGSMQCCLNCHHPSQLQREEAGKKIECVTLRCTWKANGKLQNWDQNTSWSPWINVKQKYEIHYFGALLKSLYFVKFRSGNPNTLFNMT